MPIRPASLATMSAAIAGVANSGAGERYEPAPVTVTFESGEQQVVSEGGCQRLATGQGGLTEVTTSEETRFVIFSGPQCRGARILASGQGPTRFATPVAAGSIVIG